MGVIVSGEFVRIRWRMLDDAGIAALERPDVTLHTIAALIEDQPSIWGLVAGQEVTLSGKDLREQALSPEKRADLARIQARVDEAHAAAVAAWPRNIEDDDREWEPFPDKNDQLHLLAAEERETLDAAKGWDTRFETAVELPDGSAARTWTGPGPGRWLILVENAAHCWAALRGVEQVVASAIDFNWTRVTLPGVEQILLAAPVHQGRSFDLIYPPSERRERQAALDRRGDLKTLPFHPSKGGADVKVSPVYRIGLLDHGVSRWLDVKPGDYSVTATPITALLRHRLKLFQRELASSGIYYQDDAEETGYELRWAIEDGAIPSNFHEPDAVEAYTVSGQNAPEEDKRDQAIQLYDPDEDREELDWLRELGTFRMPARIDVTGAELSFHAWELTKINGVMLGDEWVEAHLVQAALAAGLDGRFPSAPSLTPADCARAAGSLAPPVDWNAVDAADRVQRAVYVLATGGLPDAELEARLSRFRGPIVRALLARDALRLAADGDIAAAREAVPIIPPLAPGPFPRRACAVITLADGLNDEQQRADLVFQTLSAISDPLERQLARLFAGRISAVLDAHTMTERPSAWNDGGGVMVPSPIAGMTMQTAEAVLGSLEPPAGAKSEGEVDNDAHAATAALRSALRNRSDDTFAHAWSEAPSEVHDDVGLSLLMEAVRTEALDIAAFLIENGVPIAGRTETANNALGQWGGDTPLGAAVEAGLLRAVHWCLEHGADPTAAEWTRDRTLSGEETEWPTPALVLAAKHRRADILGYFLESGGDPVSPIANGITPLTAAAFGGSAECVELLLATGADANQPPGEKTVAGGPHATTPLLYACDQGHDAVVRLLLGRGADPRVPRSNGELALQLALEMCALTTLEALVSAGADATAVNSDGLSVLHTAMLKRRADALPLLLSAGAPVDLPAGDRAILAGIEPAWTALMIAAAKADGVSVSLLLTAGADPRLIDAENRTALDLARSAADPDADVDPYDKVIALLERAERLTV